MKKKLGDNLEENNPKNEKPEIIEPTEPKIEGDTELSKLIEKVDSLQKTVSELKEDINNIIADIDDLEEVIENKDKAIKPDVIEVDAEEIKHEITQDPKFKSNLTKDIAKDLSLVAAGGILGFLAGYILVKGKDVFR